MPPSPAPAPAAPRVPPPAAPASARAAAPPAYAAPPARGARVSEPGKSRTGLIVGVAAVGLVALIGLGGGAAWYFTRDTAPAGGATTATDAGTGAAGGVSTTSSPGAGTASGSGAAGTDGSQNVGATVTGGTGTGGTVTSGTTSGGAADTGSGTGASGTATTSGGNTAGGAATGGTSGGGQAAGGSTAGGGTARPPDGGGAASGGARADAGGASSGGAADLGMLDREPPELSGRDTGAAVADTYRRDRGTGGSFGATGRFRARPKVPRDLTMGERRAAVVLVNLMGLQAVYHKRTGRYGSFQEVMPVAVASGNRLDRASYRFDLKLGDDGYTIVATSMSGRALQADDSGFVTYVE
jgi:hypothetical protein